MSKMSYHRFLRRHKLFSLDIHRLLNLFLALSSLVQAPSFEIRYVSIQVSDVTPSDKVRAC